MSREILGQIPSYDKGQLKSLVERRDYLNQIKEITGRGFLSEDEKISVLEKLQTDIGQINSLYNKAWDELIQKYQLKKGNNSEFQLEFETGYVYAVESN